MSLLITSLLSLISCDWAYFDALVSEGAVKQSLREEGHHLASFNLWALRRRVYSQDVTEGLIRQPKNWTWLVFSPLPPHELTPLDNDLLAQITHGLHGVHFLQWVCKEQLLTFTTWPLRTVVLKGAPMVSFGSPYIDAEIELHLSSLPTDLSRWSDVSEADLLAALVEAYYVEQIAAADVGAFTNVDVLALADSTPVVIEVKRRNRDVDKQGDALSMTKTQANTLGYLAKAGCEVHVIVQVVSRQASTSANGLATEQWWAGASVIRPGWGEARLDLVSAIKSPSLTVLRQARKDTKLVSCQTRLEETSAKPKKARSSIPKKSKFPTQKKATSSDTLKRPPKLTSFSSEYEFLSIWAPANVKLSSQIYPSPALAFLAARTLDKAARETLMNISSPELALQLARRTPERLGWHSLRTMVASEIMRVAYKRERAQQLVNTLPLILADAQEFSPQLEGLQGQAGLVILSKLRGELATQEAKRRGSCCFSCNLASPAPWPGFIRCTHPYGLSGTRDCVGKAVVRGPFGQVLVPVMTPGGSNFRVSS
jgi:predicted NAD-dependent protein-ADP-ribosyltransferase YbiA (DUF1768 family)